jgi:Phage integrase, N-terminal SAM-like domain
MISYILLTITRIPEGKMSTALTAVEQAGFPTELTATLELAADFARASKAKATQDAYGSDFRIFESWCRPRGLRALPATAESLCAFLADEASAGRRASTLGRRLAAIRYFHRAARWRNTNARSSRPACMLQIHPCRRNRSGSNRSWMIAVYKAIAGNWRAALDEDSHYSFAVAL